MTAKTDPKAKGEPETSTVKVAMDVSGALLDLHHYAVTEGGFPHEEFLARAETVLADAKPLRGHQVDEILAYVAARTAPGEDDGPQGPTPRPRPVADVPQA